MNKSNKNSKKWTRQRIAVVVALLVLGAVYVVAQPTLEKWLGVKLPSLIEKNAADHRDSDRVTSSNHDGGSSGTDTGNAEFKLTEVGRETYKSPAGLVYTMGPGREHRIDHILRHTKDDPSRPVHGVFEPGDRDTVLALLDRAYDMVKRKSRDVNSSRDGDRMEYTIEMGQTIGYVGGENGKRNHFPKSSTLNLILEDDRVVTAYPVKSR